MALDKSIDTSNLLFGIFFLREQLHNYLDIFEKNLDNITKYMNYQDVTWLLKTKSLMVRMAEKQFNHCLNSPVEDASVFRPPCHMWLNSSEVNECCNSDLMREVLLTFDKKVMVWCYLIMVHEDVSIRLSGFLLKMIEHSKSNADRLMSELNK